MSKLDESRIQIYKYKANDFKFVVMKTDQGNSALDLLITQKWEEAQKNGVFKYVLNIRQQKRLDGNYGFLAQLNPERGEKRRKPEDISSMAQPFDPNLFNFTKIPNREILFDIGNGDGNDVVAANISPIENCHSLLFTERFKCLPQKVTVYSLKRAVDLLLLSNSPYLRMMFNSLCAHASVNHLHWHLCYLKYHMPLECIKLSHLRGPVFVLLEFPAKGFCLKLSSFLNLNTDNLVSWTYFIVNYLQTSNIAHNIYITRAKTKAESDIYDDIRVYIWARKSSSGIKCTLDFIPAVCELFGHLSIKSKQGYEDLTEDAVAQILDDITSHCFFAAKDDILGMNLDEKGLTMDYC
ncbi:GDP-D-glucose phosphorylase 1 isoform X1 [Neodiprion lecontei]|uniref:GDP-D-glucose phosphorylase 1 n=1 Tax=Neodiprion lecontei TaxID=441921 RepID=A0A6J0CEV5_NEOLC|nr:GDP-D-glucose phosphorylase 1 isoform X1 [Neodiprion lecontei]